MCVRACMREGGGWLKAFLELPYYPLFGQLVWACISLVLLLLSSLVMTSIFYFNIIDDGWGRTRAPLNSPVAITPKFIHGSLRMFCRSWTELDQLPKRPVLSYTLDNKKSITVLIYPGRHFL